jgi:GAF domain-containing protein
MIVPDTLLDPRFADNPLVTEAPHIRFYAGTPLLLLPNGSCVGTLCIIDTRPRHLDAAHVDLLQALGSLVQEELSAGAHA